ncbi:Mitochondrial carrier-like protein 2 [Gryllus bimaculatus]|nr:Mitochondrial carrier-like protein 2 [Gryllus bimaculatus]
MSNSKQENRWAQLGFRLVVNAAAHPIEYAKILIQIGHEPIPPYHTKTLFGKPALALPNVFQYISYIRSVDGFVGCYRGLGPKLCANAVSAIVFAEVTDSLRPEGESDDETKDEEELPMEERRWNCINSVIREGTARTAAFIVSQPFNVIAVRMMAQFIGGEEKYSSLSSSVVAIYKENGITGFFSGLIPRILGELSALAIAATLSFVVNNYVVEDREIKKYVAASMGFVAATIMYPFQAVSTCMAVTNSGIVAGRPPHMPVYTSWIDCWSHLQRTNQLKRGSSLIWRYYAGPQNTINGHMVGINKNFIAGAL